jgi:hypothetical protein
MGRYTLAASGSWPAGPLTCQSISIQQTKAEGTCGAAAAVPADRLVAASQPVTVTPQLPAAFAVGELTI